jgi:hypothetical protein
MHRMSRSRSPTLEQSSKVEEASILQYSSCYTGPPGRKLECEYGTLNETAPFSGRILPSLDTRRLDGKKYLYQVLNYLDRLAIL